LKIAESEVSVLSDQLEQLRVEKHTSEVNRVKMEQERDLEIEDLSSDKSGLKLAKSELEDLTRRQSDDLKSARSEISKLEAALFNAKTEVTRLEKKEDLRQLTEKELIEARKEVLLQGELLRKYREKLDKPVASALEHANLYKEAFRQQMEGIIRTYAEENNCEAIFRRSGSEFIILQIPKTENLRFWFWMSTGDNIFFSVGNQFFLFYNFNTTTHMHAAH
jgi:hypothetical protein